VPEPTRTATPPASSTLGRPSPPTTTFNRNLYPGGYHCLISPAVPTQYVDVTACPAGPLPHNVKWTVRGYTGDYATSYRIEDDDGYCLAAKDVALGDFHNPELRATKAILAVCDSSGLQKWNAPPDLAPSQFKDVGER